MVDLEYFKQEINLHFSKLNALECLKQKSQTVHTLLGPKMKANFKQDVCEQNFV